MTSYGPEDVLRFWFPESLSDHDAIARQFEWWFRGGADAAIVDRYPALLEQASRGKLDSWAARVRSRLALIIVLDQFPRSIHRGTAEAYAQDTKARRLVREGLDAGHFDALETPWQKTFFLLPLGHSEELADLNLAVRLAEEVAQAAVEPARRMLEFSASQARGHRDVVAHFGRQPHRNQTLGRQSTPEELDYLARGEFVHQRKPPSAG